MKEYREPLSPSHRLLRSAGKYHLLIGVTGSVATIKLQELIAEIHKQSPPDKIVIKVTSIVFSHTFGTQQLKKMKNLVF